MIKNGLRNAITHDTNNTTNMSRKGFIIRIDLDANSQDMGNYALNEALKYKENTNLKKKTGTHYAKTGYLANYHHDATEKAKAYMMDHTIKIWHTRGAITVKIKAV